MDPREAMQSCIPSAPDCVDTIVTVVGPPPAVIWAVAILLVQLMIGVIIAAFLLVARRRRRGDALRQHSDPDGVSSLTPPDATAR